MTESTRSRSVYDLMSNVPCPGHGDYHCRQCADDERYFATMRVRAAGAAKLSEEILEALATLEGFRPDSP